MTVSQNKFYVTIVISLDTSYNQWLNCDGVNLNFEYKQIVHVNQELQVKSLYLFVKPPLDSSVLQEKQKGRNKLVPRLLGVTKDSVLRLDEKTKEILKTWPLTTVRRWAASPNVFTLDFGDYQVHVQMFMPKGTVHSFTPKSFSKDQYYSVQTTEGEQISALIAGYIDIILKRRQRKERFGEDGNEEEYLEESFIHPGRAIEIHGLPQTLKKAKPDSLAKPGLLRNSGGKISFYLVHFFILIFSTRRCSQQSYV